MSPDPASKPRILQVITHLDLGGAEQVAISLAEQLHADCDFTFFVVQDVPENAVGRSMLRRLRAIDVPVLIGTRLEFKRGGVLQAGLKLGRLIRNRRFDIVHLHTEIPETAFAVARLVGVPARTRLLRTIHNQTLWPMWRRIGRVVERRLRGAEIVAVSQAGLHGLWAFQRAVGVIPTPEALCRVIYNGVASTEARVDHIPVGSRSIQVLFAGRFEEQKGADLLPAIIEVAARQTKRPVEFTLMGAGTFAPQLHNWAARQRTPWQVRLSPPAADLATHLGDYDLLFMPSRFEGLGLVAIEAMLRGTPVIASRAPGLTEVFPETYPLFAEPGNVTELAGVLAQSIDRIDDVLMDSKLYRSGIASKFDLTRMADRYRRCYAEGLQTNPNAVAVS